MRDVTLDGNVVRDGAFLVANGSNDSVFSEKRAILLLVDETPAPHLAGTDFGPQFPIKGAVLSVALEQPRVLADDFGPAVTRDPFKDRIDVKNASLGVGDDDAFRGLLNGGHQAVELCFRLLARVLIADGGGDNSEDSTVIVGGPVIRAVNHAERPYGLAFAFDRAPQIGSQAIRAHIGIRLGVRCLGQIGDNHRVVPVVAQDIVANVSRCRIL